MNNLQTTFHIAYTNLVLLISVIAYLIKATSQYVCNVFVESFILHELIFFIRIINYDFQLINKLI